MDWPMSRTVERQASRMADMMQKLDADPNKLVRLRAGEAYAEARTNCLRCCHARECLLWLDAVPASGEAPLFCPSFGLFKTCKRDDLTEGPSHQAHPAMGWQCTRTS